VTVTTSELDAVVRREHSNPHAVLGPHPAEGGVVVRAYRPGAASVRVKFEDGERAQQLVLEQIHPGSVRGRDRRGGDAAGVSAGG